MIFFSRGSIKIASNSKIYLFRCYGTRSKLFTNIIKQLLKASADPNTARASLLLATSNHKQISSKNFEQILFNNDHLFSKLYIIAESSTQKKKLHDTSINSTKDIKTTQATDLS